jgi:Ca2+-binding RTX toxin-like protein
MAVATAFTAINMNNWQFYETNELLIGSTQITQYLADSRTTYFYGSGFGGDGVNGVTSGTLEWLQHFLGEAEQYRVTGLSHDAATLSNLLESQSTGFLPFLFSGTDTLTGSASADQINGYGGNDRINGGLGADRINGGAGNDTITWGTGDTVNGGAGKDILKVSAALLDLTTLANNKIVNVETINLAGTTTLRLNLQDLLAFPGDDLRVTGDGADTVDFVGTLGTGAAEGTFTRYSLGGGASLLIDSDIDVV